MYQVFNSRYSLNPRQNYICVYQTHILEDLNHK